MTGHSGFPGSHVPGASETALHAHSCLRTKDLPPREEPPDPSLCSSIPHSALSLALDSVLSMELLSPLEHFGESTLGVVSCRNTSQQAP